LPFAARRTFGDKYSRKHIIMVAQFFSAIASAGLAIVSWKHLAIPAWPILQHGTIYCAGSPNF